MGGWMGTRHARAESGRVGRVRSRFAPGAHSFMGKLSASPRRGRRRERTEMTTHPRSLAAGLVAVVFTVLGSPPMEPRREPALPASLPQLGHWRNDHPDDDARPVGWLERME